MENLPGLRLFPPDVDLEAAGSWFLELLAVPDTTSMEADQPTRLLLREGHFGLPTPRALALTAFRPLPVDDLGIRYARPEMMVLSRMLEHPRIEDRLLSQPFVGRRIKRSTKDLGRVLATGTLANLPDYGPWTRLWHEAMSVCFRGDWKNVAKRAGDGLRAQPCSVLRLLQALYRKKPGNQFWLKTRRCSTKGRAFWIKLFVEGSTMLPAFVTRF